MSNNITMRDDDELVHGNVMGRIAVALFGDQNNRTDEECVARAAEVGYELEGAKTAVLRATGKEVAWREMADKRGERVSQLERKRDLLLKWLAEAETDMDALRHDIARHVQIAAEQAQELEQLRQDLAAARADATLLRSTLIDIAAVMGMSSLPSYSEWEKIRNKALQLVAALAGEKK